MSEKAIPSNTIVERLLSAKQFGALYDRRWPLSGRLVVVNDMNAIPSPGVRWGHRGVGS
jgi:hypothetical protein